MINPTFNRRQAGFSLIETLLVLGIIIAISALSLIGIRNNNERMQAQAAGQQIKQVGQGLNAYIALRYDALGSHVPGVDDCVADTGGNTGCWRNPANPGYRKCVNVTIAGIPTKRCTITSETLRMNSLVPNSFGGLNSWGSEYEYEILVSGSAPNLIIDGMVTTKSPYTSGSVVRYDLLGEAMMAAGADSGMTRNSPTRADGYNGSWAEDNRFSTVYTLGQLAYRVGYGSQAYNVYLRRDGSLPMTGNMNMDGHDIVGVGTIDANGVITNNQVVRDNTRNAIIFGPDSTSTPRATIGTSGTGTATDLTLRSGTTGKVSIEDVAGNQGNLQAGNITTTNLVASTGIISQGTLQVSGNTTLSNLATTGTITANGNISTGANMYANTFRVGAAGAANGAVLFNNALYLNNGGTNRGFVLTPADNTITLANATNLYTSGNIRAGTLDVDTTFRVGNDIAISSGVYPAIGSACTNTGSNITIRRSASGGIVQCMAGTWKSMGYTEVTSVLGNTASTVVNTGTVQYSRATCPAGYQLVSGGFVQTAGPTRSGPVSSYRENDTTWTIAAGFNDPYGVGTITAPTSWQAQALCAR